MGPPGTTHALLAFVRKPAHRSHRRAATKRPHCTENNGRIYSCSRTVLPESHEDVVQFRADLPPAFCFTRSQRGGSRGFREPLRRRPRRGERAATWRRSRPLPPQLRSASPPGQTPVTKAAAGVACRGPYTCGHKTNTGDAVPKVLGGRVAIYTHIYRKYDTAHLNGTSTFSHGT